MLVGLGGCHRTGKTTLMREVAAKNGFEIIEGSVTPVFKDMGYRTDDTTLDFATRLTIQEEILRRLNIATSSLDLRKKYITDRTPLCYLMYTLAEAVGDHVKTADLPRLKKYIEDCFNVTNRRFSSVVIVQPGVEVVAKEGTGYLNEAYMEHLNSLILGLTVGERLKTAHFYIPRRLTDLQERVVAVERAVGRSQSAALEKLQEAIASGQYVH